METWVQSTKDAGFNQSDENLAHPDEIRISCYDSTVPAFAEQEIDRLYGHLYCSPSFLDVARELDGTSTYVARKNGDPVAVLLYRQQGNEVVVISDYVTLGEEEIRRFADHMFNKFRQVDVVSFRKLRTSIRSPGYPWHAVTCTEDMIIDAPPSVKEYQSAIGKNMRRNIKRYTGALVSKFPSYRYQIYLEEEIDERHIRDIIALGSQRMKSKNVEPRFNDRETQWTIALAKKCGIVGVATIEGRVCAGTVGFRLGENYFLFINAHGLEYNDYSLGILSCYRTICECIERGAKRIHLLQGRFAYKHRLLSVRHDLVHLDLYRSRTRALLLGRRIIEKEVKGRIRLIKQWLLHDVERRDGVAYRVLAKAVNALRTMKRSRRSSAIT
jgi:hypothetical protein